MSANGKSEFVLIYRMHKKYDGGYEMLTRRSPADRAVYLTGRSGWRYSERSARYLVVEQLNAQFTAEINSVWNAGEGEE